MLAVDKINQDQAVVHHHTGEGDDAEKAHHADLDADDPVPNQRADGAEGNDGHDDQRLRVGLQRDGHQGVNQEQGQ